MPYGLSLRFCGNATQRERSLHTITPKDLVPFLLRRCPDPRTIAVHRIIVHEFGNFVSWPMLDEEIGRFQHAMKPYWLTPAREKMNAIGLLSENQVRLDVWFRLRELLSEEVGS